MRYDKSGFLIRFYEIYTYRYLFLFSLIVHFLAAYFSIGYHHYDEHFQIIEFLGLKLNSSAPSDLPWEYHAKMRPWIQVFFYWLIVKPLHMLGLINPFNLTFILRLFSGLLAISSTVLLFQATKGKLKSESFKKKYFIYLNFLWFMPYIHVRASSEAFSISLFFIALYFYLQGKSKLSYFFAGFLLGLSFYTRFQMGFAVAGLWMWGLLIDKKKFSFQGLAAVGILLAACFGALIDFWGYEEWVFSPYRYFDQNILQGKLKSFGVDPLYFYITKGITKGVPPISLLIVLSTLFYWIKRPKCSLTWISVPFFIVHCLASHKEIRFIFLIVCLAPFFIAYFEEKYFPQKYIGLKRILYACNFFLIILAIFRPAASPVSFYQFVWNEKIDKLRYRVENPFSQVGLNLNFYKRKSLTLIKDESERRDGHIFLTKGNKLKAFINDDRCELLFSSVPVWSLKYNYFNWVSRSKIWSLFNCKGIEIL